MTAHGEVVRRNLEGFRSPVVIMMVGVPGSGKSSVASDLSRLLSMPVLSSDSYREELSGDANNQAVSKQAWGLVYARAHTVLANGEPCIIDGTHNNAAGRRRDINRYRKSGAATVIAVWVDTPLEISLGRNSARDRVVPEPVIQRMWESIQLSPPLQTDGFDTVIRLSD